jgi:hypothetical protein
MSTADRKTRGYAMVATWKYINETFPAEARERIRAHLSPEVRNQGTYDAVSFYSCNHLYEPFVGIASLSSDQATAMKQLEECGKFIAREATNTFLRLIMKVVTPTLFAKKLPTLWSRDNTVGRFHVDLTNVESGRMVFHLEEVSGFFHIGPVAQGWIAFSMEAMGRQVKSIHLSNWSLKTPAPDAVQIDVQLAS